MTVFRCDDCSSKHNNICKLPWKIVLFTDNNRQMELNTVYFSLHIGLIIYCLFIFFINSPVKANFHETASLLKLHMLLW